MNIATKQLTIGFSMGLGIPLVYTLIKGMLPYPKQKNQHSRKFVGIQIGVNNYNVAIGEPIVNNKGDIVDFNITKRKNGTTDENPQKSLQEIIKFILQNQSNSMISNKEESIKFEFIGISSFGPLCLEQLSQLYGTIKSCEKQQWQGVNILKRIQQSFPDVRIGIDYDVNAFAYAEFRLGKHQVHHSLAYVSVGTGVGVGLVTHQRTIRGLTHPQGGHIIVQRSPEEFQHFKGACKHHHTTCLQGMVSSKAIAERLNIDCADLIQIADDSIIWRLIAFYLAQLCINLTLLLSPEVIVIGGGIMNRKILLGMIHQQFMKYYEGQKEHRFTRKNIIKEYIMNSKLGNQIGVKGAMIIQSAKQY